MEHPGQGRLGPPAPAAHRCIAGGLTIEQAVAVVTGAPWAVRALHRVDRRDVPARCADCALFVQASAIVDELASVGENRAEQTG